MDKNEQPSSDQQEPQKSRTFRNLFDMIRLLAGLAAAWYLLDWLMDLLMGPK